MPESECAALIMAGGRSERMRATGVPEHKGLRAVLGVPLIECNLRALLHFGFARVFVAVNEIERELLAWIDGPGRKLARQRSATLEVLVEARPRGTIGAVADLPADVDEVVVVNVDNLMVLDLQKLARRRRDADAAAAVATHRHGFAIPFGMLELEGDRVVAYREKPNLPLPISSGTYVLGRRAIDSVPRQARCDVPALIGLLLGAGETVLAYPHDGSWIDVNDEVSLSRAQAMVADDRSAWPWLWTGGGA
jgi:NDP-sugar pyrophosphorylase family protein